MTNTQENQPSFVASEFVRDPEPQTAPTRTIQLSHQRGGQWLASLQLLIGDGLNDSPLVQFRDTLEDACWLARWKRDHVSIDVCPTVLTELVEHLMGLHSQSTDSAETLDEMIVALSAGGGD